ncbi:MAG: NACHT domain-containing protein, partial [Caldilinea sp. CFX5]|nr:NACHT domain-containing protein [Caldilinea sp. CFX5]
MTPPAPLTRILLLVSNPFDNPVNIAGDVVALADALHDLPAPAEVVVQIAETEAVAARLARQDGAPFTVLHYLGHGYKPPAATAGALLFEDSQGAGRLLDDFTLLATLAPTGAATFQLAILSACHSASVALAMHALRIPHIVAIEADETIYEMAAVQFCRRFYQVLLTGGTVDAAFVAGRNAVLLDERLGTARGRAEAAKFKLLPEDGSHRVSLVTAPTEPPPNLPQGGGGTDVAPTRDQLPPQTGEGWGGVATVQIADLPRPRQPFFHDRPRHFIGRTEEMQAVLRHLAAERAVLLTGVSGVGKTALARETAHWLVARGRVHPDRAYFVPLITSADAEAARRAIAIALDLRQELSRDALAANVALARLLPPQALLILDEAENLISQGGRAVRDLLEALAQAPNRPLLIVTSQSSLVSSRLPRLALTRLTEVAALELFRLTAALDWAALTALGFDAVLAVLGYVDRLPRAIELVARVWQQWGQPTLQPLLQELRRLHDQVLADPDYPDEVKSVTVGVQLAYDRLRERDPAAAALYAHLALFPGGLPDAGVTAIFGEAGARQARLIEGQSLLERPFPDLLYLPTPFRFFALRQLPTSVAAAQEQLGATVLRFYFDLPDEEHRGWVNQLDEALTSAGDAMGALVNRYETELPSVEVWLAWAYDQEPCAGDHTRAPQLTALLKNLYVVTSTLRHQRSPLTRALAQAQRCSDRAGEANVLQALGDLERREDNLKGARERYLAALAIY